MSGLDDMKLSTKLYELLECDNKNVQLSTLQLLMRVKGHLSEVSEIPAATSIHLHIMQRDDTKEAPVVVRPVLDVTSLLPTDNEDSTNTT